MNKVLIYQTLKSKRVLDQALGEHHGKALHPVTIPDVREKWVHYNGETWPTLLATDKGPGVEGDIIDVNDAELEKLKKWESHYQLHPIDTPLGPALTFIFERPGLKAALGHVAVFREA